MHKLYLEKMDFNTNKDKIIDIIDMLMCEVKETKHKLYEHIECEMYEMVYGKKISEEMAEEWVSNMKPKHEHWTYEETTSAMQSMGYNCDKIEYFIVANMMYNDYYDIVKDDEELALKMAYHWLKDEDAKECKLYEYWKHVIKRD